MTTDEAFKEVLNARGLLIKLGYNNEQAKSYRRYYQSGQISKDKIEEILIAAGYVQVISPAWFNLELLKSTGKKVPEQLSVELLNKILADIEAIREAVLEAKRLINPPGRKRKA